ncbi:hypothetical protein FACS189435_4730 [Bacteroidia bacterium]|nr:hypothetical protein FACS189435_4730 [Bacteroidia bacterium]
MYNTVEDWVEECGLKVYGPAEELLRGIRYAAKEEVGFKDYIK